MDLRGEKIRVTGTYIKGSHDNNTETGQTSSSESKGSRYKKAVSTMVW